MLPSLHEGFGLTALEAMACGTPVACSHAASLPEVTAGAAALFDPEDPGDIAAVLGALLADEKLRGRLRDARAAARLPGELARLRRADRRRLRGGGRVRRRGGRHRTAAAPAAAGAARPSAAAGARP